MFVLSKESDARRAWRHALRSRSLRSPRHWCRLSSTLSVVAVPAVHDSSDCTNGFAFVGRGPGQQETGENGCVRSEAEEQLTPRIDARRLVGRREMRSGCARTAATQRERGMRGVACKAEHHGQKANDGTRMQCTAARDRSPRASFEPGGDATAWLGACLPQQARASWLPASWPSVLQEGYM